MKSYDELKGICDRTSRISERVVDDFLINYAAGHRGLEKKMDQQFARFNHVGKKLGKQVVNMLKAQYLAHKVFQRDGLIERFMKHPALDRFTGKERDYLLQQQKLPWRFSFSVVREEPAENFFVMEDVFTGKDFLLYSPAGGDVQQQVRPALWFNLIGFNGHCWQTYGPVAYYRGFEPDDIWFFATELNPALEDPEEVPALVEKDPLPFMMLLSGANFPLTFSKEDQVVSLLAEHDLKTLDTAGLIKDFRTEYDSGVYRISLKKWEEPPHFAQAYFDEESKLLLFSAMTQRGFDALVKAFNAYGHSFPAEAYLRVNTSMVHTAGEVLKRKIVMNEYPDLFKEDADPVKKEFIENLNAFMAEILPDINAGREPDIEKVALKWGVNPDEARGLVEQVMAKMDSRPEPKKRTSYGLGSAAIMDLPVRSDESSGINLLSEEDELLFDLHLYSLASQIRMQAPWEYLYEHELIGIQVPGKDLIYFVSVMGTEGEFTALAFYKGFEGLEGLWDFRDEMDEMEVMGFSQEGMLPAAVLRGGTMTIPHLMLSFTDREDLDKKDLAAIKRSGYQFRGKGNWPRIEEIVPGHVPVYPGRETLTELFLVMKQALVVLEKAEQDYRYIAREGDPPRTVPVWIPEGRGPKFRWKHYYLKVDPDWGEFSCELQYLEDSLKEVAELPEAGQVLQIDLFMLPVPVKEKGSRGYFPFDILMVDKQTGMVAVNLTLAPQPDLKTMYETIPERILGALIKLGHTPSEVEIRSTLLMDLLEELLTEAGCSVEWEPEMPEMDEAIAGLIEHLNRPLS